MKMNPMDNWKPFKDMDELTHRLAHLLGEPANRSKTGRQDSMRAVEWEPLVDIAEDDDEFVITAELPEVSKDDVTVTVDKGVLKFAGERRFVKDVKGKKYHRIERSYGRFSRRFTLPDDVDETRVKAEFHEGLLRISVAKAEIDPAKAVEVTVAHRK